MANVDDFLALNRDLWDKRVRAHLAHGLYPSAAVEAGTYEIGSPEVDEVGDVGGKRVVHLQCNAGADTLYWARRGATVTGVDFSLEAITEARRLAAATGAPAEFVHADVYDAARLGLAPADVVYTSMGVLWWLPDLDRWAQVIVALLAPGGFFYIHEIHPFAMTFSERPGDGPLVVEHDYFGDGGPMVYETDGTYYEATDFSAEPGTECGWTHSMGKIVSSLAAAGLRIDFLHEHGATAFRMLPAMERGADGRWRLPRDRPRVPLTFSLRATLVQSS